MKATILIAPRLSAAALLLALPFCVAQPYAVINITTGSQMTCAAMAGGAAGMCWGVYTGLGLPASSSCVPTSVPALAGAISFACGYDFCCGLSSGATVVSW